MEHKKELLGGHIILSKKLFNFLYTLLCIVVMLAVLFAIAGCALYFGEESSTAHQVVRWCGMLLLIVLGYNLFHKNNYA
jgi:threonine/homoserine/homoserine lactone efflux protein